MDPAYGMYCLVDPFFYDSPTVTRGDDVDFQIALCPVLDGWERFELEDWLVYQPAGAHLPPKGGKSMSQLA
jgi:hypothetical protein